jgi:acetoin utilization protein AcuB
MLVRDAMTREVITVSPRTSVLNARRLLHAHGIRHLPVVEDGRVVGMLSDRDVRIGDRELAESLARLQSDLISGRYREVETVMSAPALTAQPNQTVEAAARIMLDHRIGGLPVVRSGELAGIITLTDCTEALLRLVERAEDPAPDSPPDRGLVLDAGDQRPGRPTERPVALVVHCEDQARMDKGQELRDQGYKVVTCPGPLGGTSCGGLGEAGAPRCPRVPSDVRYIVMDQRTAATRVPEAYRVWAPDAEVHVVGAAANEARA